MCEVHQITVRCASSRNKCKSPKTVQSNRRHNNHVWLTIRHTNEYGLTGNSEVQLDNFRSSICTIKRVQKSNTGGVMTNDIMNEVFCSSFQ